MTTEYHAIQLTGSACQGKNCAAASTAMAIYYGSGGKVRLTADQVRAQAAVSCVPGQHSPSGGLYISDIERVTARNGVSIDYGRDPVTYYERWPASEAQRLVGNWGATFLGPYDAIPKMYRAPGSTFTGGHSAFGHLYRTDLPPFGGGQPRQTVCWHDPLRAAQIRLPLSALLAYWQAPGTVKGFAGFVRTTPSTAPAVHWGAEIAHDITRAYTPTSVAKKLRQVGVTTFGTALNYSDLEAGLKARHMTFGTSVQLIDVRNLMRPGTGPK
jgi:hypothetical protein